MWIHVIIGQDSGQAAKQSKFPRERDHHGRRQRINNSFIIQDHHFAMSMHVNAAHVERVMENTSAGD